MAEAKKRGRPKALATKTFPVSETPHDEAPLVENRTKESAPQWKRGFSGECRHIMLAKIPGEPLVANIKLGDLPQIHILRGIKTIVPVEILSVLDDCVVDMPHCDMDVMPPVHYKTKETRFPYSDLGPATWEEYEAFRTKGQTGKSNFWEETRRHV